MPATCRANVEALLRARKLDRTLVSVADANISVAVSTTIQTGISQLDQQLGGGFPLGHWSEIVGPRSSGRTSLLMAVLAAATARGELVALVDAFDLFDPESAQAAGVHLDRMLWVRGETSTPAFPLLASRQTGADRAIERALKATNLILRAGGFGVIALDLADAPAQAVRRIPFTTWMRLQRVLEGQEAAGLMLGTTPINRSAAGVSLVLAPGRQRLEPDAASAPALAPGTPRLLPDAMGLWTSDGDRLRLFRGLESEARMLRARVVPGVDGLPVRLTATA